MKMFDENYSKNQFNHSVYFPPPHSHKTNNEKTFFPNINFSLRILFVFAKLQNFQSNIEHIKSQPLYVNKSSKNGGPYISLEFSVHSQHTQHHSYHLEFWMENRWNRKHFVHNLCRKVNRNGNWLKLCFLI